MDKSLKHVSFVKHTIFIVTHKILKLKELREEESTGRRCIASTPKTVNALPVLSMNHNRRSLCPPSVSRNRNRRDDRYDVLYTIIITMRVPFSANVDFQMAK